MEKEYSRIVIPEDCTGCFTCEVSCTQEHNLPVGPRWTRVLPEDDGPFAPKFAEYPAPTIEGDTVIVAIGQKADEAAFGEIKKSLFWCVGQGQGIPGEMGHFLYHILENKLYSSEAVLHRGTGKGVS